MESKLLRDTKLLFAVGFTLTSAAAVLSAYAAFDVLITARSVREATATWARVADEVQRADIRVCAGALPPGLQRADLKAIPEPDPEPCQPEAREPRDERRGAVPVLRLPRRS